MPRPLIIAEACNPEWVSVPLVGWSHARALQKITGGHLVTQVRNRDALLRAGLDEGRDFTAIDSEALEKPMWRAASLLRGGEGKGWTTVTALSAISYPFFEHLVWRRFARDLEDRRFDVVHRLTPLTPIAPSPIAAKLKKRGVPFVLGPLNGGLPWPKAFDALRRKEKEWLSYARGAYELLPGFHATRANASAILIGSRDTWKQTPVRFHEKCFYLPENGIERGRFRSTRDRAASVPLRAVFVGRLVPFKGADMLIEAAAELVKAGLLTVDVLGDGPERPALEALIARLGVGGGVTLRGWVPHGELESWLVRSDVLAFPSIREFGGGVVLEAMSVGVVPIVVDYGGPAELVTPETGFLVPIGDRAQVVAGVRRVLEDVTRDPALVEARSGPARARVDACFTWEAKAEAVARVYRWVLGETGRPDLGLAMR